VSAALVAVDPFMTYYAQETRMYSLVAMLSFVAAGAYVQGVLQARWFLPLLGSRSLILYTHNGGCSSSGLRRRDAPVRARPGGRRRSRPR
jgi:hypothetical protein